VDILVNNAGLTRDNLFMRMSADEWEQVINVNLTASFRLSKGVLRGMMKARWGRIIGVTSIVGVTLAPWLARLTRLRIDKIALPALIASLVTIVQLNGLLADLYVAVGFGLLGYLLKRLDWPRVPFIIAFILGSF